MTSMGSLDSENRKTGSWGGRGGGWLRRAVLISLVLALTPSVRGTTDDEAYRSMLLLTRSIEQIRRHYVDEEKTSYTRLIEGALRGLLNALDEHSQFLDRKGLEAVQDDTLGRFGGVGIVIGVRDGVLTVIAPIEDTPAFRAGILPGDRIVGIGDLTTDQMDIETASGLLRGEPGTKVTVKILRPRTREVRVVELVRAIIDVATVKDARVLEDGIAYVRLVQFTEGTGLALSEQLARWSAQPNPPRALILDLRNNPGGLLRSAIEVAQLFLRPGDPIVYTQGRAPGDRRAFKAQPTSPPVRLPMAILVNGGSASASEIVAGALQDHRRAVLIGEKTFGKASVQTIIPLEEGAALRLTTARYQTPSRREIHGYGIEPDIVVPLPPEAWQAMLRRRNEPEAEPAPDAGPEAAAEARDLQLERAADVLKGVLLFLSRADGAPRR